LTDVAQVADRAAEVLGEPDRLIGTAEVIADVGDQFRNAVYRAAGCLPKEGRVIRPTYRRSGREVGFWAPADSGHLLYKALVERITAPAGASRVRPADAEPATTAQIAASLRRWGRFNHSVALCGPLHYPERDLPVAPYTFGCWLGDGATMTAQFTCADEEILEHIRGSGAPEPHPRASVPQRRALLAGLLDTDGYCSPHGGRLRLPTDLAHGVGWRLASDKARSEPSAAMAALSVNCLHSWLHAARPVPLADCPAELG
jgi:hypothetical protein